MKSIHHLAIAIAALLSVSGAAHAQIVNGGFETPITTPGFYTDFSSGSTALTGWTSVGPAGTDVAVVSTSYVQLGVAFEAQSGNQWLDLTGDGSNSTDGVSQSVATTAGHHYELSFYVGNTSGGGAFGTTSTVNVLLNGNLSFTAENSTPDADSLTWSQFTYDFVATGPTVLTFLNGDPDYDNSNGLDSVALVDNGAVSSVPEPDSAVLTLAALALVAVTRRLNSKARVG